MSDTRNFTFRIDGAEELLASLAKLEPAVVKKAVPKALRRASSVFRDEIKSNAPSNTGFMESQIKVRSGRRKKGRVSVEVQLGGGFYKGDSFYGSFQNFGWHAGPRKLGNARTWIEGEHFFEEGFDEKAPGLARELPQMIWDAIAEVTAKGAK